MAAEVKTMLNVMLFYSMLAKIRCQMCEMDTLLGILFLEAEMDTLKDLLCPEVRCRPEPPRSRCHASPAAQGSASPRTIPIWTRTGQTSLQTSLHSTKGRKSVLMLDMSLGCTNHMSNMYLVAFEPSETTGFTLPTNHWVAKPLASLVRTAEEQGGVSNAQKNAIVFPCVWSFSISLISCIFGRLSLLEPDAMERYCYHDE